MMIPFGNTKQAVSQLCLGCLNFGTRTDKETAFALMDFFVESGGNFFDTSNNYAFWEPGAQGGESETVLGEWIHQRKNRDQLFLATKVGALPKSSHGGFSDMEGLSRTAIMKSVDESLRRLRTDYIDLYYAHIDDSAISLEETLRTFDDLIKIGKVRQIGCSNYTFERLMDALSTSERNALASYCCIQQRHTYLQPNPGSDFGVQVAADNQLLSYCKEQENVLLLAYSPLLGGGYSDNKKLPQEYIGEQNRKRLEILQQVAREQEATPNQVVLAWLMQSQPSAIPLVATSHIEQLRENMKAVDLVLTKDQLSMMIS